MITNDEMIAVISAYKEGKHIRVCDAIHNPIGIIAFEIEGDYRFDFEHERYEILDDRTDERVFYRITITEGDESLAKGTEFEILGGKEINDVYENGFYRSAKYYPCSIDLVRCKISDVEHYRTSKCNAIRKYVPEEYKEPYDWKDHWC